MLQLNLKPLTYPSPNPYRRDQTSVNVIRAKSTGPTEKGYKKRSLNHKQPAKPQAIKSRIYKKAEEVEGLHTGPLKGQPSRGGCISLRREVTNPLMVIVIAEGYPEVLLAWDDLEVLNQPSGRLKCTPPAQ